MAEIARLLNSAGESAGSPSMRTGAADVISSRGATVPVNVYGARLPGRWWRSCMASDGMGGVVIGVSASRAHGRMAARLSRSVLIGGSVRGALKKRQEHGYGKTHLVALARNIEGLHGHQLKLGFEGGVVVDGVRVGSGMGIVAERHVVFVARETDFAVFFLQRVVDGLAAPRMEEVLRLLGDARVHRHGAHPDIDVVVEFRRECGCHPAACAGGLGDGPRGAQLSLKVGESGALLEKRGLRALRRAVGAGKH